MKELKDNRSDIFFIFCFLPAIITTIYSSDSADLADFVASPSVNEVKVMRGKEEKNNPGTYKIMVGNWVAQWDTLYRSWFYYNTKTGLTLFSLQPRLTRSLQTTAPGTNQRSFSMSH